MDMKYLFELKLFYYKASSINLSRFDKKNISSFIHKHNF